MFAQHAIACVLCELLLELFNVFFQTRKIGSVTSFSILFNFQGPVRLGLSTGDSIILSQKRFFVKHFFERFLKFLSNLISYVSASFFVFARSVACLTVVYFSTALCKKQVFFRYFLILFLLLLFCPVFSHIFVDSTVYSSIRRLRNRLNIFRSRREICT